MVRYSFIFTVLFLFFTLFTNLNAAIINVPDDQNSIQRGINSSEDGDTVLVQPGIYQENIAIRGRAITVASLILTTGERAYIDSTIIDGRQSDCVVSFEEDVDTTSILQGFTITNGCQSFGGGIDCQGTSPLLIDLLITGNSAETYGGGVYCNGGGSPHIRRTIIEGNEAQYGGGLCIYVSNIFLKDVVVRRNTAEYNGGGFYFWEGSALLEYVLIFENEAIEGDGGGLGNRNAEEIILKNVTITRNSANRGGGIIHGYGPGIIATIINSIIFNNENEEIFIEGIDNNNQNIINISYSDIEGGEDAIVIEEDNGRVEWGDGNIDEDPLFAAPDESNYNLTSDSPCIDGGDPDSPLDPDSSRADMGALPFYYPGVVECYVLDASDDSPLNGAIIYNQYGFLLQTDESGFSSFEAYHFLEFDLTATYPSYNDLTFYDQHVDVGDTLELVFRLTHPEFILSKERIDATLNAGDSTEVEVTITNQGNGHLEWQARKRSPGGFDPWELRQSFYVSETVQDSRIEGVVFADNRFYVSGANFLYYNDENMIYVLDREGREVNRFTQFGESIYGMKDLAWDGELIWGCDGEMVIGFTTDGDSVTAFEGPEGSLNVITWDPDREVLWIARKTGNYIHAMNLEGEEVMSIPRYGFRLYGIAYWQDALYIYHGPDNETDMVHKVDIETQDTTFVRIIDYVDGDSPRGCFITNQYDRRNTVFICVSDNGSNDRINIWQLEGNTRWMDFQPFNGILEADSTEVMGITIRSAGFDPDIWEGEIVFNHNALGGEAILPVTMTIVESAVNNHQNNLPSESGITSVYPNPFNSIATIRFDLNVETVVSLRLFDISGREIRTLIENEAQEIGQHSIVLNADNLPAGLYLLKLEADRDFSVRKIVLMP